MEIYQPFSYLFGVNNVIEDLSELRSCEDFLVGRKQEKSSDTSTIRILDKYPYSKKILTKYFNSFIDNVFGYDNDFIITTSWLVNLDEGDEVHLHNHRNCLWSGIFYYGDYTENSCGLKFRNPITKGLLDLGKSKNNPMTKDWEVKPETNLLVFWPSSIYHYSDVNKEKDRHSLALNFFPKGSLGFGDSYLDPQWLH